MKMEPDTDVEKVRTEEVNDEHCALEDIEMSTMRYRKEAGKSTESNLNLFSEEDDPKVIGKSRFDTEISEALPGSVEVPKSNPATFLIGSKEIRASASAGDPKQSILDRHADKSEVVHRFPGAEVQSTSDSSTSSGNSTTLRSLTECELAYRKALEGADNGKSAVCKCRMLKLIMEVAMEEIQKQVDEFSRKARLESHRGETSPYFTLVAKYSNHVRTLRKKVGRLEDVAVTSEATALYAYDKAAFLSQVTNEGKELMPQAEKATSDAYSSKNSVDAACLVACKVEHSALRIMKSVLDDLKNSANELEDHADNTSETNQQCANRERKTRLAHVAAVVTGVAVLASVALFEVGSDSFYAALCLGVVILGWSAIYWAHDLYAKCRRTRTVAETETILKEEQLDHIEERWNHLQEYFRNRDVSATPSESSDDTETDSWATADTAPVGE